MAAACRQTGAQLKAKAAVMQLAAISNENGCLSVSERSGILRILASASSLSGVALFYPICMRISKLGSSSSPYKLSGSWRLATWRLQSQWLAQWRRLICLSSAQNGVSHNQQLRLQQAKMANGWQQLRGGGSMAALGAAWRLNAVWLKAERDQPEAAAIGRK